MQLNMDDIDLAIVLGLHHKNQQRSGIALWNISLLGIAFFFIYTSYGTSMFIEKPTVASVNGEYREEWGGKDWNAYELLGVNYAIYALFGWISPSLINFLGLRRAMIVHGLVLSLAGLVYIFPFYYGLMVSSIALGVGQAVLWTAQGNLLTINSRDETIMRNSGIFWVIYQTSLLVGNIIVYHRFEDRRTIDRYTRNVTFTCLTVCSLVGVLALFALKEPESDSPQSTTHNGPWKILCSTLNLVKSKKMILLFLAFIYTGLEGTFFSGVYDASVAFSKHRSNLTPKRFSGISGALTGAGEIAGGFLVILFGSAKKRKQNNFLIFLGYCIHIITFAVMYFNLQFHVSLNGSDEPDIVHTSLILALICSFLIGFGDACYQNQINAFLGSVYRAESSPPFAICVFFQNLSSAIAFYYSKHIPLDTHIYILTIVGTIGTLAFFASDHLNKVEKRVTHYKKKIIKVIQSSQTR
ncbi:UNC93-like protein MFSD11 isoform X2 [Panonychus citri]|uniref:UNC93-like protein MFSD11 isoform X2 n=1 Tax=Panonychus citri TaxID=50023 RepID=UPI0023078EFE|nr:UNC93-like protein MFSD11 isoform X2 [Panonychus citri]